ncbi:MAG: hypothetical protein WCF81_21020 [Roseiarcus sp.]
MRLAASFLIMAGFFHDIDGSISQAGQSAPSALVIKVALLAQNTNSHVFFRATGLNCEKEPTCERDGDGPVDQRKNDGVDHVSVYCRLAASLPAESHRLSNLSGLAAADLIDDPLNPIGCSEDGADLATVVKKAEDGNAVRILRQERPVAGRQVAGSRGNTHPEPAHELELLGRELNGCPDCPHSIDRDTHALGERCKHFLQRFRLALS